MAETKTCTKCGESKSLDGYYVRNPRSDSPTRYPQSKTCTLARLSTYTKGPGRHNRNKIARDGYNRRKDLINEHKDVPCADCGVKYPPYVMDFDHRDPSQKEFGIGSSKTWGLDRLLAEIEKCDVVCANCHRIRTHSHEDVKP